MRFVLALAEAALDLYARLRRPPEQTPSPGWRLFLQISAALACILSLAAGIVFLFLVYSEPDPWTRWAIATSTFGLFGLPTTIVMFIPLVLTAPLQDTRMDIVYACVNATMAGAYFVQWQLVAWLLYRRSRFTGPGSRDALSTRDDLWSGRRGRSA